ncbi:MAG: protein-L-isoaspartate(D-aspartate) O-methyltransferase [Thermoguttaceae bacterium]
MKKTVLTVCFILVLSPFLVAQTRDSSRNRQKTPAFVPEAVFMVEQLLKPQGELGNERVLDAMKRVPREKFVPPLHRPYAYFDTALPIGNSQTISAPSIVAYMTEVLDPQPTDRVLEIGTGSGYQAAVLSLLVKDVFSIEIVEPLGKRAEKSLARLGYPNVHVWVGDGYKGWPAAAPFDKIIVTCSPESVPQPLIDQLKEGGRMIIPVGERYQQRFYLFKKVDGVLEKEALTPVLFVPMTGEAEEQRVILPNPAKPEIIGGDFEETTEEGRPIGWHHARNVLVMEDEKAPKGTHFLRFQVQPDPETLLRLNQQMMNQAVMNQRGMNQLGMNQRGMNQQGMPQQAGVLPLKGVQGNVPLTSRPAPADPSPSNPKTETGKKADSQEEAKNQMLQDLKTAQLIQGFAIDGKKVPRLKIEAVFRGENILSLIPQQPNTGVICLHFYDESREMIQQLNLAPLYGTFQWTPFSTVITVPRKTEEIIMFLGLFNTSGQLDVDNVSVQGIGK